MVSKTTINTTLLPNGLGDVLPEETLKRRQIINTIMDSFSRFGYADVSPPLVEYEDTLLADGPGAALADNTFRLMDPVTRRMLALRSDMTAQIARIATSRMGHLPRPLRLSYYGHVLRINPDPVNPERQLVQIGAELIGASTIHHDAEVATIALESLSRAGISQLSMDLNVPRLLDVLLADEASEDDATLRALREAVSRKDSAAAARLPHPQAKFIQMLLELPLNTMANAAQMLKDLPSDLPEMANAMLGELAELAAVIAAAMPQIALTIDPLERRGFDYHQGVGFSIFTPGVRGELGRGGRYRTLAGSGNSDLSTGVTLYLERVLQATPSMDKSEKIYLAADYGLTVLVELTRAGHHAVMGAASSDDQVACQREAEAAGATHFYTSQGIQKI
jgi:ATP phosphoribosyltransferase regulatory subunit